MIYLVLSIVTNTAIYFLFKWFEKKEVNISPAIAVNYVIATVVGLFAVPDLGLAFQGAIEFPVWTSAGIVLGVFFICIFYLMAITAQKVGVAVTTVASKMSLALAVILFAITDPSEHFTKTKILAVILAIVGVVFSSMRDDGTKLHLRAMIWPLLILLISTVCDFGLAHYSGMTSNDSELSLFSSIPFSVAAVCGWTFILVQRIRRKLIMNRRDIYYGVLLGIVNCGSIHFLVQAYNTKIFQKSTLLPINNLGIVILGSFLAILIFKEKLTRNNLIGLALSIIALFLLIF